MKTKSISPYGWVENLRFVSNWLVWSIGGFACLLLIFGLTAGPPSPPAGISYEEHMHRIENGYYTMREFRDLAITLTYLLVFSIPQHWLIRSRVRVFSTLVLLTLPLFGCCVSSVVALFHQWPDRATFIFVLFMNALSILFFLLAPLSLFFSWRYRAKKELATRKLMTITPDNTKP